MKNGPFFKTLFKGKNVAVWDWDERGVNSILITTKQTVLSFQEVGQKRKMVVKIELTLSHSPDRKFVPFEKGFLKMQRYVHNV